LRERDYLFGEHFVTVPRGAESQPEHYPGRVAELVRLQDVIVAGRRTLPALKQATSTFPLSWPLPMIRWAVGSSGASDVHAELHEVEQSKIRDDGNRRALLKELVPPAALAVMRLYGGGPNLWSGRRPKPRPGTVGGSCCLSGFEMRWNSRAPSEQRPMLVRAVFFVMASGLLIRQRRGVAELAVSSRLPAIRARVLR